MLVLGVGILGELIGRGSSVYIFWKTDVDGTWQTYQLGRAFTALTLKEETVEVARGHALQLIRIERALGFFRELEIQHFFMRHPQLMAWTDWIYSFVHIPGTIAFLVWLYYYTATRNRLDDSLNNRWNASPASPSLYAARRRAMAVCNLIAFVVFTVWPCMPPRLLSDQNVADAIGDLPGGRGFVDTVHGVSGAVSFWTRNRFCNQYGKLPPSIQSPRCWSLSSGY